VLDATQGPSTQPRDSVALAAWFAGLVEACELVAIGETPPAEVTVPVRAVTLGNG